MSKKIFLHFWAKYNLGKLSIKENKNYGFFPHLPDQPPPQSVENFLIFGPDLPPRVEKNPHILFFHFLRLPLHVYTQREPMKGRVNIQ